MYIKKRKKMSCIGLGKRNIYLPVIRRKLFNGMLSDPKSDALKIDFINNKRSTMDN